MPGGRGRKATARGVAPGGGPAPQQQLDWRPAKPGEAECPVCRCTLSQPARLPCGHRFCLGCVQAAVLHSAGCCPLCRVRCAGWLRRATLNNTLVDEPLWEYIRNKFPARLAVKVEGSDDEDVQDSQTDQLVHRQICAPGEIKNEFQADLERIRNERKLLEEKYAEVNEKLIRELQEQEKLELEKKSCKIEEDEKFARELSISLNSSVDDSQSTSTQSANISISKEFYNHLGKTSNGFKPKPMDRYISRSNVKPSNKKNSPTMTATSPELVSTAGRCGRFLRNFLNGRLWGFNADAEDASHSSTSSKIEPKVWEPQRICSNGDRELSVNSGIVIQRNTILSKTIKISTMVKNNFEPKIDSDIESEDSISQELRYFKPIQSSPVCRFNGKLVRTLAVKNVIEDIHISNKTVPDKLLTVTALEKLRGIEISNLGFKSAFVCYLTVPKSHIKIYKNNPSQSIKTPAKKSNNKNPSKNTKTPNSDEVDHQLNNKNPRSKSKNDSPKKNGMKGLLTPKKTSLMTTRSNKLSQSFPKPIVKNEKTQNRVSSRLKRSLSFNDDKPQSASKSNFDKIYTNGDINDKNVEDAPSNCTNNKYHRKLRNNGHPKNDPKTKTTHFHNRNGDAKLSDKDADVDFPLNDIDPSVLQEQKRIEEMIAQEKKDLALAKKLQRQLGGQVINTGYTLRTAAKRQATLTELMPPSKNMRI